MGNGRLRRGVLVVVGNALVFLALLIPLELVFGTWIRPIRLSDIRRLSVPIGTKFEFDVSSLYPVPSGARIRYTRDEWGLRGAHRALSAIDVLTIGGSTTEQRYLDDTATWQAVAERELGRAGRPMVIANAGVDGQSTVGHIFNFENWFPLLEGLQPRVMLFYVGVNDVMRHGGRASYDASLDARTWRVRSVTYWLMHTVRSNLLARSVGVSHGRMRPTDDGDFTDQGRLQPAERDRLSGRVTGDFLANIARLHSFAVERHAVPVFMTQTAFAWTGDWAARPRGVKDTVTVLGSTLNYADVAVLHQGLNRGLVQYCEERRVACFDLAHELSLGREDYYDFVHNSPAGAEKIGRYVAARLGEVTASRERN